MHYIAPHLVISLFSRLTYYVLDPGVYGHPKFIPDGLHSCL